jgi:dTDP-4-amino-4,6-dideoxygalactose transaminase
MAKIVFRLTTGQPLSFPSLGSMTLDRDDVSIARKWLNDRSCWYDQDLVSQFESEFAGWNGSDYSFAFMGARVALSAAIDALGLQPGDEVILPGYTCVVVPNAFHYAGIKTVYSDIELETYGLDASQIPSKINHNTKAILLHHIYGLVCRDYEKIIDIARKRNVFVIEDCAQSTGAEFRQRKVGNWGDVAVYSSEQSKVFTTLQGGIAVTNDASLANRIRHFKERSADPVESQLETQLVNLIAKYYQTKHPQRRWIGDLYTIFLGDRKIITTTTEEEQGIRPLNYGERMPAPIAALGLNQLQKIDYYNERRRQNSEYWSIWCDQNGFDRPVIVPGSVPVFLRYPVLVNPEKKRDTSWSLKELGVEVGKWFVSNLHPSPRKISGCPEADKAVMQCVNFPTIF